jgi:hypothetical protein
MSDDKIKQALLSMMDVIQDMAVEMDGQTPWAAHVATRMDGLRAQLTEDDERG